MNIQIGETIRNLRIKSNITQEKLANHLGVSIQAVSRWESGKCYPDLELIPSLAIYFGVSTDVILCVDKKITKETTNSIKEEWRDAYKSGNFEKAYRVITDGLQAMPMNYDFMVCKAATELILVEVALEAKEEECANKYLNSSRDTLYKILAECKEENIRAEARKWLVGLEVYLNNSHQFYDLTNNLASVADSKNSLLYKFHYDEAERDSYARKYIYELLFELIYCLKIYARSNLITNDERINLYLGIITLLETFVINKPYGEFECYLDEVYENLYKLTGEEKYKDEIGIHENIYNNLPDKFEYRSVFLKDCVFRIKDTIHAIDGSLK